jgi:tetratricopeptide (TPR) repeat protein
VSTESLQYRAFLSYSHQDSKIAARLHRKLESYRVPKALWIDSAGSVPARLQPVFRDREELASAARLSNSIEDALDASEALIVVCSPASVASRWVNEEISYFRKHHPDRPVLAFIIAGDPANDPRISSGTAAFPVNLVLADINQPDGLLGEPLAADARDEADGFSSAFLKLAAGLLNVGYDKLRQREQRRQQQRWAFIGGASLVLAAVFAYLAWQATVARDQAREAQAVAELELTSERQTRNFLLSVFQLADPGEARGNDVTVREVLDRAVKRIDATQFSRPVIRSRFLATMGQAYGSLGLTQRSAELLQQSLDDLPGTELSSESRIQRTDSQIGLADVLFDMGDYDRALAILDSAIDAAGDAEAHSPLQQALLANIRGDILSYQERDDAAMAEYQKAMAIVDVTALNVEEDVSVRSRSIGGIAQLKYFAGETLVAEQLYTQAADLLIPVFGEDHPDTIWALSSQASIAYINGNVELARQSWTRLLDISLRVYDENSSAIATLKNSLGLLLMQTGEFDEAEELLRAAIAIDKTQRSENFDDLTYPLSNLALVRISLGDRREAENLLLEAEEIAAAANHRWLGMVLNNLADLSCMDRSVDKGLEYSGRALPVATAEFGEADWRVERVAMTRAYCQAMAGSNIDSEQLERSLAVIIDRWGAANLYSQRAIMQLRDIHSELGQAAEATGLAARLESWMEGWEPQSISNTASPF